MGKKSKKYPAYSSGTVNINGSTKSSTYKNKNNVISGYNMSDDERRAYEYAQKAFADALPSVNTFDSTTQQNIQNQLDAYTLDGQKMINNLYNPMLKELKTDVASRFGNLDNSVFMDNLNSIESNRADAINNLAQDVLAKRNELVNDELSQRYNYLNFLQDIQNQTNSNILNFLNGSQSNSSSGNSYNAQAYAANKSNSSSTFGNYANLASGIMSTFGGAYGMAASAALQIAKKYV